MSKILQSIRERRDPELLHLIDRVEKDPKDKAAWSSLGDLLRRAGEYEMALECYDLALSRKDAYSYYKKGSTLNDLGRYIEAEVHFKIALDIDSSQSFIWNEYGNMLFALRKYDRAVQRFDRALEIDPRYFPALLNKGLALFNLAQYEEAIEYYDRALAVDSNSVQLWYNKGYALQMCKRYEEAVKCYDEALNMDPTYPDLWNGKGNTLLSLRKYDEALRCYEKALELDPGYAFAWSNKGLVFERLAKYEEAARCHDKAVQIVSQESNVNNQQYAEVLARKGEFLLWRGNYEQAGSLLEKALKQDPNNISALNGVVNLYTEHLMDFEKGYSASKKILELQPDPTYITSHAEILVKLGRYGEARRYCHKAMDNVDPMYRTINRFLITCSYLLDGSSKGDGELKGFIDHVKGLDRDFKVSEDQYVFRGLVSAIRNSRAPQQTKFTLLTLLDILTGRVEKSRLSALS